MQLKNPWLLRANFFLSKRSTSLNLEFFEIQVKNCINKSFIIEDVRRNE